METGSEKMSLSIRIPLSRLDLSLSRDSSLPSTEVTTSPSRSSSSLLAVSIPTLPASDSLPEPTPDQSPMVQPESAPNSVTPQDALSDGQESVFQPSSLISQSYSAPLLDLNSESPPLSSESSNLGTTLDTSLSTPSLTLSELTQISAACHQQMQQKIQQLQQHQQHAGQPMPQSAMLQYMQLLQAQTQQNILSSVQRTYSSALGMYPYTPGYGVRPLTPPTTTSMAHTMPRLNPMELTNSTNSGVWSRPSTQSYPSLTSLNLPGAAAVPPVAPTFGSLPNLTSLPKSAQGQQQLQPGAFSMPRLSPQPSLTGYDEHESS